MEVACDGCGNKEIFPPDAWSVTCKTPECGHPILAPLSRDNIYVQCEKGFALVAKKNAVYHCTPCDAPHVISVDATTVRNGHKIYAGTPIQGTFKRLYIRYRENLDRLSAVYEDNATLAREKELLEMQLFMEKGRNMQEQSVVYEECESLRNRLVVTELDFDQKTSELMRENADLRLELALEKERHKQEGLLAQKERQETQERVFRKETSEVLEELEEKREEDGNAIKEELEKLRREKKRLERKLGVEKKKLRLERERVPKEFARLRDQAKESEKKMQVEPIAADSKDYITEASEVMAQLLNQIDDRTPAIEPEKETMESDTVQDVATTSAQKKSLLSALNDGHSLIVSRIRDSDDGREQDDVPPEKIAKLEPAEVERPMVEQKSLAK